MPKYCAENERVKRNFAFFLEAANGKQNATIDAALKAIDRFETSTNRKPFRKFHIEQARAFRAQLIEEPGAGGKPLSAATVTSTLKHLRNFFLWLQTMRIISRHRRRTCASPGGHHKGAAGYALKHAG
jgi:site-specific recombinase XerD